MPKHDPTMLHQEPAQQWSTYPTAKHDQQQHSQACSIDSWYEHANANSDCNSAFIDDETWEEALPKHDRWELKPTSNS